MKLDRLVWAGSSTFRIGRLLLGVRSSNQAVHDLLRETLIAHLVEGVEAPNNYSILLAGDDPESKDRAFHFVYRGFNPVVRTRDPQRLVPALLSRLAGHLDHGRSDHVRLDSVALVAGDVAVLAPAEIRYVMPVLERRLNSKGLRVVDQPWTALDVETGELVVTEPALDVDPEAQARLTRAFPRARRPDPPVAPGRYRVAGWAFGLGHAHNGPISRSQAVALACPQVLNVAELGAQRTLDGLARAIRSVDPVAMWADSPAGLVGPLVSLAAGGSKAT